VAGWLDQASGQGQAGQVGTAAAAGLVPDPVQVRADRAGANVQLGGDLGVGTALGNQPDQFPLPGAELPRVRHRLLRRSRVGEQQGLLGGSGYAHRRAAVLGRPRPAGSQCLPGLP
jgi:hypothetical protein